MWSMSCDFSITYVVFFLQAKDSVGDEEHR